MYFDDSSDEVSEERSPHPIQPSLSDVLAPPEKDFFYKILKNYQIQIIKIFLNFTKMTKIVLVFLPVHTLLLTI